ncbi:MAG: Omp28 family outer membrane lipoprotein [Bacteroidetes bacterium]|nr:Omp28 family outer membrane lipoprotein [Bacteroidota bacterium]HET6243223.1 Omp28 family outer membrane lipoprotein [Bacteroidia bacterium]
MRKFLKNIFYFLLITSFCACDFVDQPFSEIQTGNNDPVPPITDTIPPVIQDTVIRKILIEDFTGHTCGNCPAAANTAKQIQDLYGKKVIVVGVHSGYFAKLSTVAGTKYKTDFRTIAGEAYNNLWKNDVAGNPNGFVNRSKIINSNIIIQPSAWGQAVELLKNALPDFKIELITVYDAGTRSLKTIAKNKALNNLSKKYNLVVYLIEDNVQDWQKDYSFPSGPQQDVENYMHRHVLRDNINGTWGEEIVATSLAAGDSVIKTYNNYLINPSWKANDCSVVAYIYDVDTYEIMQAEEVHIIP